MRGFDEIGKLNFSDEVNEAYQAYASLYLDWVDDNLSHFMWRNTDIYPITQMKKEKNNKNVEHAYWNAAFGIAKTILTGGYYSSFNQFYDEYPSMKKWDKLLVRFAS